MEENKRVDESWKEKAEKEKVSEGSAQAQEPQDAYHAPDFNFFITTLSMQALIALEKLENPVTKKKEKNLNQARFIIDTLDMLKEKTKNNLTQDEKELLENVLSDLKMIYAQEVSA